MKNVFILQKKPKQTFLPTQYLQVACKFVLENFL